VSGLQKVEPGCETLHTIRSDDSLASSFSFQPDAVMFTAFVGLTLNLHRCLALDIHLVLFTTEVCAHSFTVPARRPSLTRFACQSAFFFPEILVCPGREWISVFMLATCRVLALWLILPDRSCRAVGSRCSILRKTGCKSHKTATFITLFVFGVSLFCTDSQSASPIAQ